ncbi:MarR family transcriptional regulator [Limnohabitans sp. TS-CS-82]|jgi:DNA-binding MarR family transcriptional regulator|uniref:MarR family winged helix-turn-helix transcriptional regulator n=1 Tax=Limnohabitans sp. TS-CS-82 TaxID=2094193 RepID=UPI000CF293DD|nr:MarR family transcriptional regulator [Limnohabitans sp. TS-CS-82]PQA81200.1 MarR family transcriptional regulator [Limnohabitans sp. TS-CS-82]
MTDKIDTRYLETLLGYNTRRATLTIISRFIERMAEFDLRPVDFSVLSLIGHNPGITSRELCNALNILPPNMVGFLKAFEKRELIDRAPHPTDGRAMGLSLTQKGQQLMQKAEVAAIESDASAAHQLSAAEQKTLMRLLQKIYRTPD